MRGSFFSFDIQYSLFSLPQVFGRQVFDILYLGSKRRNPPYLPFNDYFPSPGGRGGGE